MIIQLQTSTRGRGVFAPREEIEKSYRFISNHIHSQLNGIITTLVYNSNTKEINSF